MSRFTAPQQKPSRGTAYIAGLLLAGLFFSLSAFGQNANGTMTGTVQDPSGAVIPGATVIMKNEASGDERRTVTNGDGFFSVNAVQEGDYTVTITAQGFQQYQQKGVHFDLGDKRNLANIALQVGSSAETVEVTGASE